MVQKAGSLSLKAAVLTVAMVAALAGVPGEAKADASQLCRAGANLVLAPFDFLLAPVIVAKDEYYGLTEVDDPMAIKVMGAVPGYVFLLGVQTGGAIFREIAAVFEFIPGIVTLFREGSQPALYRSAEDAWALYAEEYGPCPVKIGISYNTINDG